MEICLRKTRGLTLIELLIALAISGILTAGLYGTFIGQQKTYAVQEQVVDMQQNVRAGINKMVREIRMAGFGNVSAVLPVNSFNQVFTMNPTGITIIGGFDQIKDSNGNPITVISTNGSQITLSAATGEFDGAVNGYISVGGLASYKVNQPTGTANVLTLDRTPTLAVGAYIFKVQAITYTCGLVGGKPVLQRDENTTPQPNPQILADNIENIQFAYFDSNGNQTAIPANVRMISLAVTARTDMSDPNLKGGDGYRRRQIFSNIQLRNSGLTQ